MADRIHRNVNQLMVLSKEYERKVPFQHFYDKQQKHLTETEVHKNIDNKIKSILQNVIDNYLDLDIAFIEIHKLIMFITNDIYALFPYSSSNHFMAYYKFLIHFLVFGCCLGTKYTKYIVLNEHDEDYRNNQLLRYCINEFLPKVTSKHIKYKECNKYRDSIKYSLEQYIKIKDITELIADFVEFKFEEFFMTLSVFFKSWEETQVKNKKNELITNFDGLWSFYGFEPQRLRTYFIPKLLFSKQFISINDNYKLQENLEYFGNNILLKSIKRKNGKDYEYLFIEKIARLSIYQWMIYGLTIYALLLFVPIIFMYYI